MNYQIHRKKPLILSIFGTRPEAIKFGPVLQKFKQHSNLFDSKTLITSQHTDLLTPFIKHDAISVATQLQIDRGRGTLDQLAATLISALDPVLSDIAPDLVLVQGDTTSAFAGALSAFHHHIPVGHIEAGLRSGEAANPFPEEMNRRLITQIAALHFAATPGNVDALMSENVPNGQIHLTGNTIVDALNHVRKTSKPSAELKQLLAGLKGKKLLVVTSHRRENFGAKMRGCLTALRDFTRAHDDVALVFPAHPNPFVQQVCKEVFDSGEGIHVIAPLDYPDFIHLLDNAWLIASDSGGVQEEAPTLGKPLLVLRDTTERPEVIACGCAKLAGTDHRRLTGLLNESYAGNRWSDKVKTAKNPFGRGDAADRITAAIIDHLGVTLPKDAVLQN